MKTTALIADDEQPSRERLKLALSGFDEIEVVAEAATGVQALELIRNLRPGLIFLDIQMPLMSGLEVLSLLKTHPAVIFITAFDEYALRAFELHALDYLLKPYSRERLYDAIRHAVERMSANGRQSSAPGLDGLLADYRRNVPFVRRLSIKQGREYRVFPVSQADCFRADRGLVFWVEGHDRFLVDETLTTLESRLDPSMFMRIHRNAIVNLDAIDTVIAPGRGRLTAVFASGERVEIGRSHLDAFRSAMSLRRSSPKNHRSYD